MCSCMEFNSQCKGLVKRLLFLEIGEWGPCTVQRILKFCMSSSYKEAQSEI
jgi:hypothetical protein